MKLIVAVVILSVSCPLFCLSQQEPDQPQRYSYQVTGSVLDTDSQPMARITVCFEPSERPINGRVPCAKTTDGGRFSVGAEDVPDKYRVCASTVDSPVPLNTDPSEKQPRTKCTEPMEFGAQDESREVTIQFEAEEASQIGISNAWCRHRILGSRPVRGSLSVP